MTLEHVHQLRAIEALRAGVPNRDVVRALLIFERTRDEDVQMRAMAEWMGFPMANMDLKLSLREIGEKIPLLPKPRPNSALEKWELLAHFF